MPAIPDDFQHINYHYDDDNKQQFNHIDIDFLNINQLDIQHHDNDNHHGGAMHRRMYLALERGWPDMAALRHRQLLDGVRMPSAGIAGDRRRRVSDGVMWKADMQSML